MEPGKDISRRNNNPAGNRRMQNPPGANAGGMDDARNSRRPAEYTSSNSAGAGGAGVGGGGGRGRPANGQGRPGASEELYGNPNMKKITAFSFAPPGKNIPTRPAAAQGTACKILMKSCHYLCDIACV
jgi:hypothetical protein